MGAVDGLLDSAVAAVTRGEPLAPLLDVTLPTVTWREGYDMAEVTAFLDSLRVSAHGMDPRK
jgi:DivIVA domain-containing protein